MSSEVIYVAKGAVTAIAKELGCCTMTVCHALKGRGKGHSKLKKMIRRIARERYAGSDQRKEVKRGERIVVPQGANIAIAMNMGVNIVTVRKALKGYANTALARRIREEALKNFGGKRVDAEGKFLDGAGCACRARRPRSGDRFRRFHGCAAGLRHAASGPYPRHRASRARAGHSRPQKALPADRQRCKR